MHVPEITIHVPMAQEEIVHVPKITQQYRHHKSGKSQRSRTTSVVFSSMMITSARFLYQ